MSLLETILVGVPAGIGLFFAAHCDCYGKYRGPTPRSIYRALRKR